MLSSSEVLVFKAIQQSDGISRKMLAEKLNLSQASITNITQKLIADHFISQGERVGSGLGRKEVLLYPNPDKFTFLGIDIGGYRLRLALANNRYEIAHFEERFMQDFEAEENVLEKLIATIRGFLDSSQVARVDAIGIGVTGIIDPGKQTILNIPNLQSWDSINIVGALRDHFACPVYLEESGRTMAIAEKLAGKAKTIDDFIVVHVAYGVVAGIFNNGKLLRGVNNVGGLLGHITVDESAGRCSCGNYGCLENIVTLPMLGYHYEAKAGSAATLAEAYGVNDKDAIDVCIGAGKSIGIVLSNVVNLFNPEVIYLGGPVFDRYPIIFEEVKRTILLRANRFATVILKLDRTSFGDRQGIMGALLVADTLFISDMEQ